MDPMNDDKIRTDTIRHALADLRAMVADGNAVTGSVDLDDGTLLKVGLARASDGGRLIGVYEAVHIHANAEFVTDWLE